MTVDALELEIENAWHSLTRAYQPREIYLSTSGRLLWGDRAREASHRSEEVGTFTKSITLADFRAEVFYCFDHRGGKG